MLISHPHAPRKAALHPWPRYPAKMSQAISQFLRGPPRELCRYLVEGVTLSTQVLEAYVLLPSPWQQLGILDDLPFCLEFRLGDHHLPGNTVPAPSLSMRIEIAE